MNSRHNLFLTDEQDFRIREIAFKSNRKTPEILRDAITHYLASQSNQGNGPVAVLGSVAPDVAAAINEMAELMYKRIGEISAYQKKEPQR